VEVMGSEDGCLCIDCFVELGRNKWIEIVGKDIERMEIFNPEE